jgi:glycosyltransferase involved in cell wall biosynthesis
MKKVLIISYFFPPDPAIGSLRMQGLAKYLSEFGWEPIILTKKSSPFQELPFRIIQTSQTDYNILSSIMKRFGLNTKVTVKKQIGFSSKKNKKSLIDHVSNLVIEILAYPDAQKDWYADAINTSNEFLKYEKIDALVSSSSPQTSSLIAKNLKKEYGIPWIADLRDLWTQNHYYQYSCVRRFFEKKLELKTLETASAITTVSQYLAEDLESFHKNVPVYSILNGFDLEEVNNFNVELTDKFTITYTGTLYNGKRDPKKLFQALRELIDENKIDPKMVEVRFYGPKEDWMNGEIDDYNLQGIVSDFGFVSRDIALIKQSESQLLLLLLWDHPSEVGVLTGKLFEYLASKRPILVIGGSKGAVNEVLEDIDAGIFVSSVEDIKTVLKKYYDEYQSNGRVLYRGNNIEKYSQREMALKFAEVLDLITL